MASRTTMARTIQTMITVTCSWSRVGSLYGLAGSAPSRVPGEEGLVDLDVPDGEAVHRQLLGPAPAAGDQVGPQVLVLEDPADGLGERRGVAHGGQQRVDAVGGHVAVTVEVRGDERAPGGHGLEEHHAEALAPDRR